MKKTILAALVAICLTSCEDEILATASDTRSQSEPTVSIKVVVDTVPDIKTDTICVEILERHPIGLCRRF